MEKGQSSALAYNQDKSKSVSELNEPKRSEALSQGTSKQIALSKRSNNQEVTSKSGEKSKSNFENENSQNNS